MKIQTVLGTLDNIDQGISLAHEHLNFDLRHVRKDNVSFLKDTNFTLEQIKILKSQNINLIVDLSNQNMNSDKSALQNISKAISIPVVASTGYYLDVYQDQYNRLKTIEELKNEFIKHITIGFDDSNIKAGIIGEIATSSYQITDFEKKVFTAAVEAQKITNCPIYTHVNLGQLLNKQVQLLEDLDAKINKIILGHIDLIDDDELVISILKKGFNIGYDTIGKINYRSDEKRLHSLIKFINLGFASQIVLSMDISNQNYLTINGGFGYGHLIDNFYPKLKEHISGDDWQKISSLNIIRILDFEQ